MNSQLIIVLRNVVRLPSKDVKIMQYPTFGFSTSCRLQRRKDRQSLLATVLKKDEGIQGERTVDLDFSRTEKFKFIDDDPSKIMIGGTVFSDIPICNIRVSRNNSRMVITNSKGVVSHTRTCGCEGYKNAKKGTNVAAQATGLSIGRKALESGISAVRVIVKGLGPGRMASVKGLQMSGMDIVSITDETELSTGGRRPRKMRRL